MVVVGGSIPLAPTRYKSHNVLNHPKPLEFRPKKENSFFDFNFNTRRLVVSYKLERAKKDRFDREKAINALRKKLGKSKNPASLISNYGYKKYITVGNGSKIPLNEEKINKDIVWDGLHGLITNLKEEDAKTIYSHYRNLYQIEDAFRINKSDLKIRPVSDSFVLESRSHLTHLALDKSAT